MSEFSKVKYLRTYVLKFNILTLILLLTLFNPFLHHWVQPNKTYFSGKYIYCNILMRIIEVT